MGQFQRNTRQYNTQKTTEHNLIKIMPFYSEPIYLDLDLSPFLAHKTFQKCPGAPKSCRKPVNNRQVDFINLEGFKPENIEINVSKTGRVCITGSKDKVVDSGRNGQRKTTVHIQEEFDLPEYVVREELVGQVESRFEEGGRLVFSYPKKKAGTSMDINFEGEEMVTDEEETSVGEKPVVVTVEDADGNSEINV